MDITDTDRLIIFDTTLRDGEQSPGIALGIRQKLEIAAALDSLGVDVIEAGFPAASLGDMQAVSAVAAQVARASVCALARCHEEDIRAAAKALKPAAKPRLHVFIATSPIHRKHKLKMSSAQVMKRARESIRQALASCSDVEFSAEDATRTEVQFLCDMVAMAADEGVRTVNIPDTVGYSTPNEFALTIEAVSRVIREHPRVVISAHCHDDLGMAVANSLAGVAAGARQVECTVNGIGERAGNAALEEVVMAIRTRRDRWPLAVDVRTTELLKLSALVARHTGFSVPPNKAIVGANAFAHEAGIHQHGVIGNSQTYEIIRAEDVGAQTSLVLGKHSGRHAFDSWLQKRGVKLDRVGLDVAFAAFKASADAGRPTEAQILEMAQTPYSASGKWRIQDVRYSNRGTERRVSVTIVDRQGRSFEGHGIGPLARAAIDAVSMAVGKKMRLIECSYDLQSQGDGTLANAQVEIEIGGQKFVGSAVAVSEMEAVAYSIVEALPAFSEVAEDRQEAHREKA